MLHHRDANDRTPKAVIRMFLNRFLSTPHERAPRGAGKVAAAALAGGAIVAIGAPLALGSGDDARQAPVALAAAPVAQPPAQEPVVAPVPPVVQAPVVVPPPAPPAVAEVPAPPAQQPAEAAAPAPAAEPVPAQPVSKSLNVAYQAQKTGFWCGPAATRMALSAKTGDLPDQAALAGDLGTTDNGTDTIDQVVNGLNKKLAGNGTQYTAKVWADRGPLTPQMTEELWSDTVRDIDEGKAMVANIVAPPGNQPPGYPSGDTIYHYITITGYDSANKTVHINDPAHFKGIEDYWLSVDKLASLIQSKGYAA